MKWNTSDSYKKINCHEVKVQEKKAMRNGTGVLSPARCQFLVSAGEAEDKAELPRGWGLMKQLGWKIHLWDLHTKTSSSPSSATSNTKYTICKYELEVVMPLFEVSKGFS
jgi:hypothetical protein